MLLTKPLLETAKLFFRLGCTSFGGPAVHIAMMREELVNRRKWTTDQHFLDLVSATNLIPGPNSTEMTMHFGYERAGWKGLVVAGVCFIVPAVVLTGILAWLYQQYGTLPQATPYIYGIKPAVLSVILMLTISLARKALQTSFLVIVSILGLTLTLAGFHEILVLFSLGAAGAFWKYTAIRSDKLYSASPIFFLQIVSFSGKGGSLFLTFLKIGSILYGSGYVLFAFLDAELVKPGYLSQQVLTDAIAVGQMTPGPVFSSATFIGWQMGGFGGAIAATAGIFLPSFIFVALLNPIIPKLRQSPVRSAFLDTVNAVSIAIIFAVAPQMGRESICDIKSGIIFLIGLVLALLFPRLNTAFIIVIGAFAGYILYVLERAVFL
jgi:chromate transporter